MIKFIRGNTSANNGYTGPNGSLSVDTEQNNIRLHDGQTAGGFTIASIDPEGSISTISATSPIKITGTTSEPVVEIQEASTSQDGYLSKEDKAKIDGLGTAANKAEGDFATSAQGTRADTAESWGDHAAAGYEEVSNKGKTSGYAGLDGSGKVPAEQLPSYVEDVIEESSKSAFPGTGESGKIYIANDTGKTYRWGGSSYTEISSGEVNSVNGKKGVVTLDTGDVSEGSNLYFTADRAKTAISVSGDLTYSGGVISFSETYSNAADIKTAYESNSNTNAFSDSLKTKLEGVDSGAEKNKVDSVNGKTGAVNIPNADKSTAGLVSTGTQKFSGNKTFTGTVTIDEGEM